MLEMLLQVVASALHSLYQGMYFLAFAPRANLVCGDVICCGDLNHRRGVVRRGGTDSWFKNRGHCFCKMTKLFITGGQALRREARVVPRLAPAFTLAEHVLGQLVSLFS